jgi:hypothetical protein
MIWFKMRYLLLWRKIRSQRLYTIATLDNIGLQRDRARATMQLEEQAAGIAKN